LSARSAHTDVYSRPAADVVDLAVSRHHDVVFCTAVELVRAWPADNQIGTVLTANRVGAVVTVEAVAAGSSSNLVVTGCAVDRI
jgi:hypothetical protein